MGSCDDDHVGRLQQTLHHAHVDVELHQAGPALEAHTAHEAAFTFLLYGMTVFCRIPLANLKKTGQNSMNMISDLIHNHTVNCIKKHTQKTV